MFPFPLEVDREIYISAGAGEANGGGFPAPLEEDS